MGYLKNFIICSVAVFVFSIVGSANAAPITAERLANAPSEPHNWLTVHKDFGSTRFSNLLIPLVFSLSRNKLSTLLDPQKLPL